MQFLARIIKVIWRLILLPDTGSLGFGSIELLSFFGKYANFSHSQDATDYEAHESDFRGESITLQTKNYSSLCIYFIIQIPPFTDLTCSACWGGDDMEFTSRASGEWCSNHQWAITCSIGVQSFCIYGDVAMWLKCIQHPKNAILMQRFCNGSDPCLLSVQVTKKDKKKKT